MGGQSAPISLIVGLGNPGNRYADTRHNAGFWFVEQLAQRSLGQFRSETKFQGDTCRLTLDGRDVWLLKPTTYMNNSGQSAQALASFFKIPVQRVLVVHDELDLPPGVARLKRGGGHGGHNGLRDLIAHMGKDFARLRIGIGHPGSKDQVTDYVLKAAGRDDQIAMEKSIDVALGVVPDLLLGNWDRAVQELHRNTGQE